MQTITTPQKPCVGFSEYMFSVGDPTTPTGTLCYIDEAIFVVCSAVAITLSLLAVKHLNKALENNKVVMPVATEITNTAEQSATPTETTEQSASTETAEQFMEKQVKLGGEILTLRANMQKEIDSFRSIEKIRKISNCFLRVLSLIGYGILKVVSFGCFDMRVIITVKEAEDVYLLKNPPQVS